MQRFSRRQPQRARLNVEQLEGRLVPATFNVNTTADLLNPGQGMTSLRSAIQQADHTPGGNTINLTVAGTYRITLAGTPGETDNAAGEFAILPGGGNLTLVNTSGSVVIVDGNHLSRVFDIDPAFNPATPPPAFTVTFQGLTIQDGFANDANVAANASGGGIRALGNASVTLNNVLLTNNAATADGGGIVFENAVSTPWTLTVNASVISHNHAGDAGGGIDTDGAGKVFLNAGSRLSGNTSVNQGAGIWLDAIQNGNAFETANLTVTDALIDGNAATATDTLGGGIGNAGNGAVVILNSTVANNFSQGTGGGFGDENNQGTLTIRNSTFVGNFAVGNGGGIDTAGTNLSVFNSSFKNNGSGGNGGGIDAGGTVNALVANSLLTGNSAAGNGGALSSLGGMLEASSSQFTGNSAGGSGGAISAAGNNLLVFGSTLNNNRAALDGGGISLATATPATVEVSTLVGNTAGRNGGGIFDGGTVLSVLACTINGNATGNIGGGISIFVSGSLTISNTIVFGNTGFGATDVFATITDNGGNLIGVAPPGFGAGTLVGVNPKLGRLQNNGGQFAGAPGDRQIVQTEALTLASPAVGKGLVAGSPFTKDERLFADPAGGRTTPSIGAFEPQWQTGAGANQVFVESVYEVLLNRPVDPGAAFWVNQLNNNVTPASVIQSIENSPEYRTDVLQSLYQRFLGRQADSGGLTYFLKQFGSGGTVEQVEAQLVGSPEYFQLHGGSNDGFLQALYLDALNRLADPEGLAGFSQSIGGGATRQAVAAVVFSSAEFQAELVGSVFSDVLGRGDDGDDVNFFGGELKNGATDQAILAQILGSGEAYANRI